MRTKNLETLKENGKEKLPIKRDEKLKNLLSNDVYDLIEEYIVRYDIPIPKTFSLRPCGLYARKRLNHWNQNNTGSMHLDATNLKEVILEWLNGPYLDKDYVTNYDIETNLYEEVEKYIKKYKFDISIQDILYEPIGELRTYLYENLEKTKVDFNGIKGITLYNATNYEDIIVSWLKINVLYKKKPKVLF